MREFHWLMVAGTVLFASGAAVVLAGIAQRDDTLVLIGADGLAGAALCVGVGAWRVRTRVDWGRVESEQQLSESGPLGQAWLRIRKALFGRH